MQGKMGNRHLDLISSDRFCNNMIVREVRKMGGRSAFPDQAIIS